MPTPLPDGEARHTVQQAYQIADYEEIHVDIRSLSDFAHALRLELDTNLLKFKGELERVFGNGSQFALTANLQDVAEQRRTYEVYLQRTRLLFNNLVEGTSRLASAAEHIGASYGRSDEFAMLTVGDIDKVLPSQAATTVATETGPE